MKKVTQEFVDGLHLLKQRGVRTELSLAISDLKIGEILFISKEEWSKLNLKSEPSNLINSNAYNPRSKFHGWKFTSRKATEGWVITRNK